MLNQIAKIFEENSVEEISKKTGVGKTSLYKIKRNLSTPVEVTSESTVKVIINSYPETIILNSEPEIVTVELKVEEVEEVNQKDKKITNLIELVEDVTETLKNSEDNMFERAKKKYGFSHKNMNCSNGCYHMKVQAWCLSIARPKCPICGGAMLTKEELKLYKDKIVSDKEKFGSKVRDEFIRVEKNNG